MKIEVARLDNGRWAVLVSGIARWVGWEYETARRIADALVPVNQRSGSPGYNTINRAIRKLG